METRHIKDFAMVETLDSHEDLMHMHRQLTHRRPVDKVEKDAKTLQPDSTSIDNAASSVVGSGLESGRLPSDQGDGDMGMEFEA